MTDVKNGVFEAVMNAMERANLEREADNQNWRQVFFERTESLPYPERVEAMKKEVE